MMTKEEYERKVIRMWDSLRKEYKGKKSCSGVDCKKCPIYQGCHSLNAVEMIEVVEKWNEENTSKECELSQLEYDILKSFIDDTKFVYYFYDSDLLMSLLKKGYFQGANNDTDIYEYIENCVIKGEK